MSTKNNAGKAAGQAAALPAADAQRLRNTVKTMDAMAQEGFGGIEALARVALMALETPDAHRFPELIAGVLSTIAGIAQTTKDAAISCAEDVGCGWQEFERTELRRMGARNAARDREGNAA